MKTKKDLQLEVNDRICGCGKKASEHDIYTISYHHYWYFHKEKLAGCVACGLNDKIVDNKE